VRPSKVDRVTLDPRADPEVVSVEVYVSVDDDGRGPVWSGWRYLGLATVVVAAIVVLLVSSLSSVGVHSRSASSPLTLKDSGSPPPGARNMLLLVSHPDLAHDAVQLVHHDRCAVSRSAARERAIETLYARAVAAAQGAVLPGRAKLQATTYPMC
jgi:hypothetical protein